jgi:hypothetical protein
MAQRLEQPPRAFVLFGTAEEDRSDGAQLQIARQVRIDDLRARNDIVQDLLHQCIVVVRQSFEQMRALFFLAR